MLLGAELREELAHHAAEHVIARAGMKDRDWAANEPEFKLVLVPLEVHAVLSFPRLGLLMKGSARWLLWCDLHQKNHLLACARTRTAS